MCVALSPTSTTCSTWPAASGSPSAAATSAGSGRSGETYSSSRPSAGTIVAVTFGGKCTSANDATIATISVPGSLTVLVAFGPGGATASDETLTAGRTVSPPSTTSTWRTKPSRSMATTGMPPVGASVTANVPALTGIESSVNVCGVPAAVLPSRSVLSAIVPVSLRETPEPSKRTVCTAVPRPATLVGAAVVPSDSWIAPYTSPV